ncbi:MAG: EAL domain-containing protein [Terracidiphilus sp.]|nr:EAL domain-containing protein [Terracidiphilus sp.]MDR3777282.1 EAL domain-containing protein [Terracidiphilus sp.]
MTILRRHFVTTLVAMIIMAACGTFVGYQLADTLAVRVTENRLDQYASRILANEEATSTELRTVLDAVSASRYSTCSSAEIDYFRTLIFAPEYLKDAGRMRNGKIECSAALGQPVQPGAQSMPDFTQQDGSILYRDLVPYRSNGLTTITLQRGDAFVVFTPLTRLPVEPPPMHYTETVTDAPTQIHGRLLGESLQTSVQILTSEGRTRIGDNLYATRCSTHYFNCVTAYTSLIEVMQANRGKVIGFIGLFRVMGGLAGLGLALLFYRYWRVEQQLRRAIRRDELFLVYQPIVQLHNRRITGAEALARWTNKQGVEVSPEVFVKIAEEHGFVGEITRLVVRHALRDFGETLRRHPEFRLNINAAAADLADPGFLPMLNRAVDEAAVPARSLGIEITERSTVMREVAIETIRGLRARGHSVQIDDFGTGYSSLSYLHDLSVDAIKIDKAFTLAIGTGSVIEAILPQILVMAEALKLQVTVEGIETDGQASYFESATQSILAQGWLFGRPVPLEEFLRLLAEDEKKARVAM